MKIFVLLLFVSAIFADDRALKKIISSNNEFSSTLYREIVKNTENNFMTSPLSAEISLALAQLGSKGKTAQELKNALFLPKSNKVIRQGTKQLLSQLKETKPEFLTPEKTDPYIFNAANKIYVKDDFEVKSAFQKVASDVFSVDIENIDFSQNEAAAASINNWVDNKTEHKITEVISSQQLSKDTKLILINALYFKARWYYQFDEKFTSLSNFSKTPTETIEVKTMHSNSYHKLFLFGESDRFNAKFLELPFEDSVSMTVILPNRIDGLEELERDIDEVLKPQPLTYNTVEIALPKFKFDSIVNLKTILRTLGVNAAFDEFDADLSGIAGKKGELLINDLIQKSFIEVNEEGVEAAAASIIVGAGPISGPPPPKEFIVDHPFIFYIKIKEVIAFVGRVIDPSA